MFKKKIQHTHLEIFHILVIKACVFISREVFVCSLDFQVWPQLGIARELHLGLWWLCINPVAGTSGRVHLGFLSFTLLLSVNLGF